MRALRWIKRYWYLPALAALAFLGWIFRLASTRPTSVIQRELEAIDAGERAAVKSAEEGKVIANAEADRDYEKAIGALDKKQRAKNDRLRRDPRARVRWLNRLSSRGGGK